MLTGYWPPTNEMIRRFSPDPGQNPDGWIGSDWEGRGYDVYAFFPEFDPPNCTNCGKGTGDFEVDYQDTSGDWWSIADALQPVAIITFSRGFSGSNWEVEMNQRNFSNWFPDYESPFQPTPSPPDGSQAAGHLRLSTLPVQDIVDAVNGANLGINAYICWTQDGGNFLSGFIAYHGVWYQDLHKDPTDPAWSLCSGHVHVGTSVTWDAGFEASKVTLRTVLDYVDASVAARCDPPESVCAPAQNSAGPGAFVAVDGSASLRLASFDLDVTGLPPDEFGLTFAGLAERMPHVPFGDGILCVDAPLFRLTGPVLSDPAGELRTRVELGPDPLDGLVLGQDLLFQHWYRDPAFGGTGSNLSEGVRVRVCR